MSPPSESPTIEKTAISRLVSRMLGLDLHAWEQTMLLALAVVAIGGIGVAAATYAVIRLQRVEVAAAKHELDEYKATAAASIAEADKKAGEARERSLELEKGNLILQSQVEKERIERLKLEERLGPRKITSEQRASILEKLRSSPKGTIVMRPSSADSEPLQFSAQVAAILTEAGFNVQNANASFLHMGLIGLFISVRDLNAAPGYAGLIQRAFTDSGVAMNGRASPDFAADMVAIDVGAKP